MWNRFKIWLIVKLGGQPKHNCLQTHFSSLPRPLRNCVERACEKVVKDPSFSTYEGSNLGRNVLRDEASEWTKLYLKEMGLTYRDSDVHLACELYHWLIIRKERAENVLR